MSTSIVLDEERRPAAVGEERVLGRLVGAEPGPTLICVGGLHGNEPAGVRALKRVFAALAEKPRPLRGEFLGLAGNLTALRHGRRFMDRDLNRHWLPERVAAARSGHLSGSALVEDGELLELLTELEGAFERARGPIHVVDFHTTSGKGPPFATVADTLRNRAFALNFPAPIILGLEEELEGTLTDYVGNLGYTNMGFEGGQHGDPASVDLDEAAIWIALRAAGLIAAEHLPEAAEGRRALERACRSLPPVFEVRYRHPVTPGDGFRMEPGFRTFQLAVKGQLLAQDHEGPLYAGERGRLLMPLYQEQGEDGYFLVRRVSPRWLKLSALLRRSPLVDLIVLLPGIDSHPDDPDTVIVDKRVARFLALELFHLLGFRRHRDHGKKLVLSRRRHDL